MSNTNFQIDLFDDGIAILTLDMKDKGANVLTTAMVEELERAVLNLSKNADVKGLLIRSAKPKIFIAGADVGEILSLTDPVEASEAARSGQDLMMDIENLPFPTAAAIDGSCLGGGLEFALACTYRIASDESHTKLALPEVKLGIIPGFGGTQRLPKVVGFVSALDLIVSGKTLSAERAHRLGLVDEVAPASILEEVAIQFLKKRKKLHRPTRVPLWMKLVEKIPRARKEIVKRARQKTIQATSGFYPAPFAALDVLEQTYGRSHLDGYEVEGRRVGELIVSPVSKALIRLFQATEDIRKEGHEASPKAIKKVGVLGAGVMGAGIAQLVSAKGHPVRLRDMTTGALDAGLRTIEKLNQSERKKKRISQRELDRRWQRVSPTTDWSGFARADLVIEAIIENMDIKKSNISELSKHVSKQAVIATNTSALSISEIASSAEYPERVVGIHFFNPVHRMPLVEVVKGHGTSKETIATAVEFSLSLGKTPIIVADRPGFLVNRLLGIYLNEACCAAEEGIQIEEIENAMKAFGMPMGPFELMDEVGLDIAEKVGQYLADSLPHFPQASNVLTAIRSDKRVGKKGGKGFYIHGRNKGEKPKLDHAYVDQTLKSLTKEKAFSMDTDQYTYLVDRFVLLMFNEATRCLEEGVISCERDIDVGMVLGTGFAPFRGGLIAYGNKRGMRDVHDTLLKLSESHGEHFLPTATLERHVSRPKPQQEELIKDVPASETVRPNSLK